MFRLTINAKSLGRQFCTFFLNEFLDWQKSGKKENHRQMLMDSESPLYATLMSSHFHCVRSIRKVKKLALFAFSEGNVKLKHDIYRSIVVWQCGSPGYIPSDYNLTLVSYTRNMETTMTAQRHI